MVTLILDKVYFISKNITRFKEAHFLMINRSIYQEDIIIINAYVHLITASKYMKQKLVELQGGSDKTTIIAGDFSNISITDRTSGQDVR